MERSESEITNTNMGSDPATAGQTGGEQGGVGGRVKSVASSVKEKASSIPALIADGLEAGANALRQNKLVTSPASDGAAASTSGDSSITAVTETLATGMQSSADWIRDADLEKLKTGVEQQVKEHPARSLLVALGAGYLIGKALRR
jgi:hypothetical protein